MRGEWEDFVRALHPLPRVLRLDPLCALCRRCLVQLTLGLIKQAIVSVLGQALLQRRGEDGPGGVVEAGAVARCATP